MATAYSPTRCTIETAEAGAPACIDENLVVARDCGPDSQPRLLDRLRLALRSRHYSRRTERTYVMWVKRFIIFHNVRHPADMAEPEVNAFLTHLAVEGGISASTQNQALSGLLFLYRHVLRSGAQIPERLLRVELSVRFPRSRRWKEIGRPVTKRTMPYVPSFLTTHFAGEPATTSGRCRRLLGQKDVKTTTVYTHVLNQGTMSVESPMDKLEPGSSTEQ